MKFNIFNKKKEEAEQINAYDEYVERQKSREIDNLVIPLPKQKPKKVKKSRWPSLKGKEMLAPKIEEEPEEEPDLEDEYIKQNLQ